MAAPAKFPFDTEFADRTRSDERAARPTAEIAEKIAAAEARAYRDGYDAAQREAKVESDRRVGAGAARRSRIAIKGIAARFAGIETRMETEAVDVAVAVAAQAGSELIAREPLDEIAALVERCFSHLVATPASRRPHQRSALRGRPREDRAAGRAKRLRRPPRDPGRTGHRHAATAASNGPTAAWCGSAPTIEAEIDELVGRYMASRDQPKLKGHED